MEDTKNTKNQIYLRYFAVFATQRGRYSEEGSPSHHFGLGPHCSIDKHADGQSISVDVARYAAGFSFPTRKDKCALPCGGLAL